MGQSPFKTYELSEGARRAALAEGDITALLELHRSLFGGWRMDVTDEPDDDEPDDDEPDDDEPDDDEPDDDEADKGSKRRGQNAKVKQLHDENSRRRNENKQLKTRLAELESSLKGYTDADKTELDKASEERDAFKGQVDTLTATNRKLAIQVAFLGEAGYSWHNPKTALRLLDLDGVEIDDEGEVTGLTEAVKKLADENPFLLKGKGDDDEDEDDEKSPPSGQPVGSRSKRTTQRQALEKKYRLG